ncbi:MAG: ribonuclease J [Spirochaetes bacterium]|nr:ribonuclease J [Spirochaetota bacterium]
MAVLRIIPIGGLGEIGRNMTLFETENTLIAIDCGVMFPSYDLYGIDLVIPDFDYIRSKREKFKALFLTHGHEDHIGGIPYLIKEFGKVNIYGTKLTNAFIKNRLIGLNNFIDLNFIELNQRFKYKVGDFILIPFRVNHSIADSVGFIIETKYGNIVYTGDFKIDNTPVDGETFDFYSLAEAKERGVLLLLSDSTNSMSQGFSESEKKISGTLEKLIKESKGRIIFATFSTNIHRIQQIAEISIKNGKHIFVSGMSLEKNIKIAKELGYLDINDNFIHPIQDINDFPNKEKVIIVTGTQGEPLSVLSKIADDNFKFLSIEKGDIVVFSSSTIPGNEPLVVRIINKLYKLGAKVYNKEIEDVHVSGHASAEELKIMLNLTKPSYFIPVHGELRHLYAHAELAKMVGIKDENIFILSNGDVIEIDENRIEKVTNLELNEVFIDGKGIGDIPDIVIKDRKILGTNGVVFVLLTVNKKNLELISNPEIVTRGFIYVNDSEEFIEKSVKLVIKIYQKWLDDTINDRKSVNFTNLKNKIRSILQKYYKRVLDREPMILSMIVEIEEN